jgi:hypothetical protein
MLDCSDFATYGNSGCTQGYQELAYLYSDAQPIMPLADYPNFSATEATPITA